MFFFPRAITNPAIDGTHGAVVAGAEATGVADTVVAVEIVGAVDSEGGVEEIAVDLEAGVEEIVVDLEGGAEVIVGAEDLEGGVEEIGVDLEGEGVAMEVVSGRVLVNEGAVDSEEDGGVLGTGVVLEKRNLSAAGERIRKSPLTIRLYD